MNEVKSIGSEEMLVARQASRASLAFGLVLATLGIFSVLAPLFAGMAVAVLVGMLLLAGGIAQSIVAFQSSSFGQGAMRFLFGALSVVAAVIMLATPAKGLGVLTWMLAVYFVVSGGADILLSLKAQADEGKGWILFSGIVTIALGVAILVNWPVSGVWAVGLYVGVRLLMHGLMLMAMGSAGLRALTHLQDTRLAELERHVRSGAQALQQTQAALADHSGMLLALANELRNKVSSSEVDPAIVELNQELGAAREQMQAVAAAAKKSWSKTQDEANAAFEKLQQSTSKITKQLRAELGLDKGDAPSAQ